VNGILAFLFVFPRISANQTLAISSTVDFDGKALTIQFETLGLFASTPHRGDFYSMQGFHLTRRRRTFVSIHIIESFGAVETRYGFSPKGWIGKTIRTSRRTRMSVIYYYWRLLRWIWKGRRRRRPTVVGLLLRGLINVMEPFLGN
jgi:hypothetical protein